MTAIALLFGAGFTVANALLAAPSDYDRETTKEEDSSPSITTALEGAPSSPAMKDLPHCGESVAEAKDRGCIFDPMMNAWTPTACHFSHILEEFLAVNETWWYDEGHQEVLPMSELRRGELQHYYPQDDHHLRHCLYTWRKLSWAYATGSLVDLDSASYKHGGHCAMWLTPGSDFHPTPESTRGFTRCVAIGSNV